jgi:LPS export ABC transporter protein LptC
MVGEKKWPGSRRPRRWQLLLGLAVLAGLATWGLWGRRPPPPPPPQPAAAGKNPARMEALALTEIQDGDKRWLLEGQKADFHPERDEISINGVRIEFLGPGEHMSVTADAGVLNTKTRVLTLTGHVVGKNGDTIIKTGLAVYQPTERILLAPEDVTMEGPRIRVQGKELRVWLAEKRMVLAKHRLTEVGQLKGTQP